MNFLEISGLVAWVAYGLGVLGFAGILAVRFLEVRKPRRVKLGDHARAVLITLGWPLAVLYCAKDEL